MPFTNVFDVTQPPDTQLANLLGQDIRNFKLDIQQRVAVMSGLSSAKPNFAADAQPANWTGALFFATDNSKIYQFNGSIWVDVTSTFIPTPSGNSFYNASCATGVTIPGGTLVAGAVLDFWLEVTQAPGASSCNLSSPIAGGLPTIIPANSSGGTVVWMVSSRIFVPTVGVSGFCGGYYLSLTNTVGSFATPNQYQSQTVNTTNNISITVGLGSGCTAGPIRAFIT